MFRVKIRPKFVTTYKTVTEVEYRCCPGFFGSSCDMGIDILVLKNIWKYFQFHIINFFFFFKECFNCTTLERMERRLRSVEDTIKGGGSSLIVDSKFNSSTSRNRWLNRRQIRPGRPDKSHVNGVFPGSLFHLIIVIFYTIILH